jgi:hopanoid biosynthesis associated protein HpnK
MGWSGRESQVILSADDFGHSPAINAAIIRAHRAGVLTSASLMVTGDACAEAVNLARATPTLAVGLHLVVVGGRAALSHQEIPHLVDRNGCFPADPLLTGLRYAFDRAAQAELAREMAAQFARFAATGLPLSHVDGHQHLHIHPVVFNLLLPLAEQHGATGVRLPRDDLWLALQYSRRQIGAKIAWAVALGLVCRWCASRLRDHPLATPPRVYGVMQSGQMHEAYVVKVLRRLPGPAAELYFHPSLAERTEASGPNPGDLATLLSPAVGRVIADCGLRPATYATLQAAR